MSEINSNAELKGSLKAGFKDAYAQRGGFVWVSRFWIQRD